MKTKKALILISLMIAGEMTFMLPFVISRVFRPTFLKVFDITNLQLGLSFSVYGIVAMICYFAGGPFADRYSPRKLITISMLFTALGGVIMATIPSIYTLTLLYAFWGITTILLFWAAYIKAIRAFGGDRTQGRSYGLVDAGRGFVAALMATVSVLLLNELLPTHADNASTDDLSKALGNIILIASGFIVCSAALIWFLFPKEKSVALESTPKLTFKGVKEVMKNRSIWLQALILLCAYAGFKSTDDFSLYASDVLNMNDVNAAHVGTIAFWVRPFAALGAGLLGDRILHSKVAAYCFVIIIIGSLVISSGYLKPGIEWFVFLTIASTSVGICGLRGIYFALFQEAKIPLIITGSAAGFISVIGYLPDIFMGPLMGYVLDRSPGELGHQHLFGIVAFFAVVGLIASLMFKSTTQTLTKPSAL